jgi:TRAP-type C4-dicarboxylate transport system permease small subunit
MRALLNKVTGALAAIGAVAVAAIMVLTVVDVTRRTLTDKAIEGVVESAPLLLLAAAALGMAQAERNRIHVRTSMVTSRLPLRPRLILRAFGAVMACAVFAWITYESLGRAITAIEHDDVTAGFMAIPLWPALVLVPIGFGLFTLHVAFRLSDDLRALATGGPDPVTDDLEGNLA